MADAKAVEGQSPGLFCQPLPILEMRNEAGAGDTVCRGQPASALCLGAASPYQGPAQIAPIPGCLPSPTMTNPLSVPSDTLHTGLICYFLPIFIKCPSTAYQTLCQLQRCRERPGTCPYVAHSLMKEVKAHLRAMQMNVQRLTGRRTMTKYNKEPGLLGEARGESFPEEIMFV